MSSSPVSRTEDTERSSPIPPVKEKVKRRWVSYIWDTFDKTPEERRLIFKFDSAILTFASLGYFIKYLDQVNISNAFVSGMKEDLDMYGDQLSYMQTCWTVGYVIDQIPSNLLLTRIKPRYWIPTAELLWTVLTFSLSRCNTLTQFYAIRTFYPGMQYIIGSWYRKDELAKRSYIFHTSGGVASMFSGYLMDAVLNLAGKGGFKGWQWLFLINGIISLPVAISSYFVLPDVPEISEPWYLTKEKVALAQQRMQMEDRKNRGPFTKAKLKKIFSSWHIYLLSLLHILFNNAAASSQPVFQQFLKESTDPTYTTDKVNAYPTTTYAVQVVTTLVYAWCSDTFLNGSRWPPIIFGACLCFNGSLGHSDGVEVDLLYYLWCRVRTEWSIDGLGSRDCSEDNEERSLVIGSMNEMAYVVQVWLPLIVWQQVNEPKYQKGFITVSCLSLCFIIATFVVRHLDHKEQRAKESQLEGVAGGDDDFGSPVIAPFDTKTSRD
ncbi:uncharacterized protein N7483_011772 [Penicillium malachiteum]|uniref:uncharacterized protein n=1 Tax=Penicillium malachiteum TaxID=1324776 RepID=UPI002546B546|nr:uncharacterized protein N7483_011772 [Penicillium malachiteum]KAJ5714591.1 hypothetical protein N7483_011772 [Penicillium malachiteum]